MTAMPSRPPIPRVELACTPTPLVKLERLSRRLGVELWVKRRPDRRDPHQFGARVCFVHTGGVFSLFPLREPLSRLLDSALVGSASDA
jgi:1-aminocyclopropane-1-carboxylate deaminase/D-cysteine desulfhydrase-like pyridoxal-dependent ACC family enzyme